MIDKQEIFNLAYIGLQNQGFKQALMPDSSKCAYRTSTGLKCAIGHVIADRYYKEEFEGKTADYIFRELNISLDNEEEYFLDALQSVHDGLGMTPLFSRVFPEDMTHEIMKDRLHIFAKRYGLIIPNGEQND